MKRTKLSWRSIYPALRVWAMKHGPLKLTVHSSFHDIFKGYHFVSVSLVGLRYAVVGFSVEKSKSMARNKAVSELFENLLSEVSGWLKHPSGVGVGYSKSIANQKAKMELYERDRFFNHYLTSLPFLSSAELDELKLQSSYQEFERELGQFGIEVVAKEMLPMRNYRFVIIHCFGSKAPVKNFGVVLGVGSGLNLSSALAHACCEARMLIYMVVGKQVSPWIPKGNKYWVDNPYFSHHLYGRKLETADRWRKKFVDTHVRLYENRSTWLPVITFKSSFIQLEPNDNKSVRLFFSVAQSSDIQEAFWGAKSFSKGVPIESVVNTRANVRFIQEFKETVGTQCKFRICAPKSPHIFS